MTRWEISDHVVFDIPVGLFESLTSSNGIIESRQYDLLHALLILSDCIQRSLAFEVELREVLELIDFATEHETERR